MANEYKICKYCGSDDIVVDSTVRWDVEKQDWEWEELLDRRYCGSCRDDDCDIIGITIDPGKPQTTVAVMVESIDDDRYHTMHEFAINTTGGDKYYIYCESQRNPYPRMGNTELREKYEAWPGVIHPGDLVVLRSKNEWQWELVKEDTGTWQHLKPDTFTTAKDYQEQQRS